jgi:hypothetical protein
VRLSEEDVADREPDQHLVDLVDLWPRRHLSAASYRAQ